MAGTKIWIFRGALQHSSAIVRHQLHLQLRRQFLELRCHQFQAAPPAFVLHLVKVLEYTPEIQDQSSLTSLIHFRARKAFSSGIVEGLNNKAKVTMRKAYGFRTLEMLELTLYHVLVKLPKPKLTHSFY